MLIADSVAAARLSPKSDTCGNDTKLRDSLIASGAGDFMDQRMNQTDNLHEKHTARNVLELIRSAAPSTDDPELVV